MNDYFSKKNDNGPIDEIDCIVRKINAGWWLFLIFLLMIMTAPPLFAEVLAEIQVTDAPVVDYEFDWGRDGVYCPDCNDGDGNNRLVYSDREHNMWLAHIDPETGDFYPSNGQGVLIDTKVAFATELGNGRRAAFGTQLGNGPEWMNGVNGSQIVYTKYFPGLDRLNTSAPCLGIAKMVDGTWEAGRIEGGITKQCPMGTIVLVDPSPRINYQNFANKKVYWRYADDPGSEMLLPISDQTGAGSRRWVEGTDKIIYSGAAEPDENGKVWSQIFLYDVITDEIEQLTFEPINKMGAMMWHAPELSGALVFLTITDRTNITIYRYMEDAHGDKGWKVYNNIAMPEQLPYVWSPEVFVYDGRSWIFFQISSNSQPSDMSVPTQIALTGIYPFVPSFRMLTNNSFIRRIRMDPEYYILNDGPYIYYNRYIPKTENHKVKNDGVWRVSARIN